jgi:hypothetical protein
VWLVTHYFNPNNILLLAQISKQNSAAIKHMQQAELQLLDKKLLNHLATQSNKQQLLPVVAQTCKLK